MNKAIKAGTLSFILSAIVVGGIVGCYNSSAGEGIRDIHVDGVKIVKKDMDPPSSNTSQSGWNYGIYFEKNDSQVRVYTVDYYEWKAVQEGSIVDIEYDHDGLLDYIQYPSTTKGLSK